MAERDPSRGFGGFAGERGGGGDRREDERRMNEPGRARERRSFEGGEPWRAEGRYGARYDQDRTGYRGQEYGMEGGAQHRGREDREQDRGDHRESWRPDQGEPYGDLEFDPRNRGAREFGPPADYAYHPPAGHEFDADYLHWREEQMRSHDRDYQEWRTAQRDSYDDDYRRFRHERRQQFGRTFQDWRNERGAVGGIADTTAAAGVGDDGDKAGRAAAQALAEALALFLPAPGLDGSRPQATPRAAVPQDNGIVPEDARAAIRWANQWGEFANEDAGAPADLGARPRQAPPARRTTNE